MVSDVFLRICQVGVDQVQRYKDVYQTVYKIPIKDVYKVIFAMNILRQFFNRSRADE